MNTNEHQSSIVTIADLQSLGFSRHQIPAMLRRGEIERISRGIFFKTGGTYSEHGSLAVVARRVPNAVITLLSALRYYELGTQSPAEVWISLPHGVKTPSLEGISLIAVHQTGDYHQYRTNIVQIEGTDVHITSPERTIVDCFRFRNKMGIDIALEALKEARRTKIVTAESLVETARKLRVFNIMKPYLEVVFQ